MDIDRNDYLLPNDVADRLTLSGETIRRWCRQGRIPCVKLPGGTWLVHRSVVQRHHAGAPWGGNPNPTVIDSEK